VFVDPGGPQSRTEIGELRRALSLAGSAVLESRPRRPCCRGAFLPRPGLVQTWPLRVGARRHGDRRPPGGGRRGVPPGRRAL